jgi:membrane protease YdiL (CAAX protease family)
LTDPDPGTDASLASSRHRAAEPAPELGDPDQHGPGAQRPNGPPADRGGPTTFSLEGRAAPALYAVGWIASVLGLAVIAVSFMAAGGSAAPFIFVVGLAVAAVGLTAAGGAQAIERARRPDLAYRGPSPVLAFGAVVTITLLGVIVVLAPLVAAGVEPVSPLATATSLLITTVAYAGIVRLLVVGTGALSWREMGLVVPAVRATADLALGALFAVPVLIVTGGLAALLAAFLEVPPNPLPEAVGTGGIVLNLLSAAVIAPIGEELFFRGFATTAWARALGPGQAVVRGAVFFALAHVVTLFDVSFSEGLERAVFAFVARLPIGLALGWLFLARRSLPAAIGLHAAFNGLQVLALALALPAT